MKKGKVFFHPIDGSGALTISWESGFKGDAIEAKKGSGVGFFSKKGDLLCVIFDEVRSESDHQFLEFQHTRIDVTVKNSQVAYKITQQNVVPCLRKKCAKLKKGRAHSGRRAKSHPPSPVYN